MYSKMYCGRKSIPNKDDDIKIPLDALESLFDSQRHSVKIILCDIWVIFDEDWVIKT